MWFLGTVALPEGMVKQTHVARETAVMDFRDMNHDFCFIASVDFYHVCCNASIVLLPHCFHQFL